MYGNPYFNNFRENQQQPIQNIINTQMPLNNLFMAQFLKENEKVEEMFVNHKTAFIDLFKKELKIKDKDLKQMQYLLSTAQKTDTIIFRDTLFRDRNLQIDTLLGDSWYNIKLGLSYPNLITTTPTFKSEKYIVTSSRKETIKPPKKCAILRWFQKKHKVVEVIIHEKNPYITNKETRFIEIVEFK